MARLVFVNKKLGEIVASYDLTYDIRMFKSGVTTNIKKTLVHVLNAKEREKLNQPKQVVVIDRPKKPKLIQTEILFPL